MANILADVLMFAVEEGGKVEMGIQAYSRRHTVDIHIYIRWLYYISTIQAD